MHNEGLFLKDDYESFGKSLESFIKETSMIASHTMVADDFMGHYQVLHMRKNETVKRVVAVYNKETLKTVNSSFYKKHNIDCKLPLADVEDSHKELIYERKGDLTSVISAEKLAGDAEIPFLVMNPDNIFKMNSSGDMIIPTVKMNAEYITSDLPYLLDELKDRGCCLYSPGDKKILFLGKEVFKTLNQRLKIQGRIFSKNSITRSVGIASALNSPDSVKSVIRTYNGVDKLFAVLTPEYHYTPQTKIRDILSCMGKIECVEWRCCHDFTEITVLLQDITDRIRLRYKDDDFEAKVNIRFSDVGSSPIAIRGIVKIFGRDLETVSCKLSHKMQFTDDWYKDSVKKVLGSFEDYAVIARYSKMVPYPAGKEYVNAFMTNKIMRVIGMKRVKLNSLYMDEKDIGKDDTLYDFFKRLFEQGFETDYLNWFNKAKLDGLIKESLLNIIEKTKGDNIYENDNQH